VHLNFYPLRISNRVAAADDAVCLTLTIPEALCSEYQFDPGQHVALRAMLAGKEVRRTYSIINGAPAGELRLGIRVQPRGGLSNFIAHELKVGDSIDALSPTGRFIYSATATANRYCLAIAAGSGITPILSIVTAILERHPDSRVVLLYGNRTVARTMFAEDLLALKNRFMDRLAVHFIMSREPQEMDIFNGRLDGEKLTELAGRLFDPVALDDVYICGPGSIVNSCRDALIALGVQAPIHFERFTTTPSAPAVRPETTPVSSANTAVITVIQDGRRRNFKMTGEDESILAAGERAGLDLPYSCRAGVCSTCRVRLIKGKVTMEHNVALEEWELTAGFILACQARPSSSELEISYDEK
jgi:ring-1,2-phenylacetyl-CoA epoxidase subunit PaaE